MAEGVLGAARLAPSGHCAAQSLLRASPGWPSMATRTTHASCPCGRSTWAAPKLSSPACLSVGGFDPDLSAMENFLTGWLRDSNKRLNLLFRKELRMGRKRLTPQSYP